MAWKILRWEDNVWQKLVRAKYLRANSILECKIKSGDSSAWKGILRYVEFIKLYLRWTIGDGKAISFWYDNWLGTGRICDIISTIHQIDKNLCLADVLDDKGNWLLLGYFNVRHSKLEEL